MNLVFSGVTFACSLDFIEIIWSPPENAAQVGGRPVARVYMLLLQCMLDINGLEWASIENQSSGCSLRSKLNSEHSQSVDREFNARWTVCAPCTRVLISSIVLAPCKPHPHQYSDTHKQVEVYFTCGKSKEVKEKNKHPAVPSANLSSTQTRICCCLFSLAKHL